MGVAEAVVPPRPHDDIPELVSATLGKKLAPEVSKAIRKHTADLTTKIQQLQRVNQRRKKVDEEIATLGEWKTPPGVREFALSYESKFLDQIYIPADDSKLTLSLKLPPIFSVRKAKEYLYLHTAHGSGDLTRKYWMPSVLSSARKLRNSTL